MMLDQSIAGSRCVSPRGVAQSTMSFQIEDKKPARAHGEQLLNNTATIKSKSLTQS
jgi:hypothetical protein